LLLLLGFFCGLRSHAHGVLSGRSGADDRPDGFSLVEFFQRAQRNLKQARPLFFIEGSEAIAKAGTYIVTLKCEGEAFPESHRALLVVVFKI
jgi:hypothetical protein